MDANVKKSVLRMIPYGLFVLTATGKDDAAPFHARPNSVSHA